MQNFSEIKNHIKNLGEHSSIADIKKAGLRLCKNTETGDYWLIEAKFLKSAIKSPREVNTIAINPERLPNKLFICNKSESELEDHFAFRYIEWGKSQGFNKRPTCASREYWWNLGDRKAAEVNCNYLVDDRMRFYFTANGLFASDNFQEIHGVSSLEAAIASVPSTILFAETLGRMPFGGGLLKIQTFEVEKILIINPGILSKTESEHIKKLFYSIQNQPIVSIFKELGLPRPNFDFSNIKVTDVTLDNVLPDRRALDKVVFEAIGLTEDEQLEVYKAVVELVKNRLTKARSV